jgi:hypothetical protein
MIKLIKDWGGQKAGSIASMAPNFEKYAINMRLAVNYIPAEGGVAETPKEEFQVKEEKSIRKRKTKEEKGL